MKLAVAITGASGSIYAQRLIEVALDQVDRIYLLSTEAGEQVADFEIRNPPSLDLRKLIKGDIPEALRTKLRRFEEKDLFAPIASGTSVPDAMIVVPCSMGTLARVRYGLSSNLIERAADVVLKQQKKLVIVPRETPLNTIHLENMLGLSQMGVQIVPAMPAFYHHPKTIEDQIDFVVARALEALGLRQDLMKPWNARMI